MYVVSSVQCSSSIQTLAARRLVPKKFTRQIFQRTPPDKTSISELHLVATLAYFCPDCCYSGLCFRQFLELMSSRVAGVVPEYQPRSEQNILRICTSYCRGLTTWIDGQATWRDGQISSAALTCVARYCKEWEEPKGSQRMNTYLRETFEEVDQV